MLKRCHLMESQRQKVKSEMLKYKRKAEYTMGEMHANVMFLLLRKLYFPFKSQNATQHLPFKSAATDQSCKSRRRPLTQLGSRVVERADGVRPHPGGLEGGQRQVEGVPGGGESCSLACLPSPRLLLGEFLPLPTKLWALGRASIFLLCPELAGSSHEKNPWAQTRVKP